MIIRLLLVTVLAAAGCSDPAPSIRASFPDNVLPPDNPSDQEQREIDRLLDEAIEQAFAGAPDGLSDADRIKRLNWWVHTHTHLSNPESPVTLLNTLQQRRGACGAIGRMFIELARRLGYEARARGIFCLPIQGGHVLAEVKYDGALARVRSYLRCVFQ